jgi:diguanylate cyclase (GGDEF)-like protein
LQKVFNLRRTCADKEALAKIFFYPADALMREIAMNRNDSLFDNKETHPPQTPVADIRKNSVMAISRLSYPRFSFLGLALAWTMVVGLSLWWNLSNQARDLQAIALNSARISAEKDLLYRQWAIIQGGIYVPVTARNLPSPLLAHLPIRDIVSSSGPQLTLIPPATMIKQVYHLGQNDLGNRVHVTSLKPMNPANAPDPWESKALKAFQEGQKEIYSIGNINGQPYFRLMHAYTVQEGCLKCHHNLSGRNGGTYGALSVAIPIAPLLAAEANTRIRLLAGHGFLWLLGLIGLIGADHRLTVSWRQRDRVDRALQEANDQLRDMVQDYRRVNQEISLINDLTDQLHACFTNAEAFQIIARLMPHLFPGFSGGVLMLSSSNNYLETKVSWGTLPPDQSVIDPQTCWALRRGRAYQMQDPDRDILCDHLSHPMAAGYLCVPLVAHGETLGIFHLRAQSPEGGTLLLPVFSEDLQRLVRTVADHLALSLGNLKLQDILRYQAIRDPLTGLYNRRFMLETLEREIFRMKRKEAAMSIIMLDLDHFKRFNDTFGHSAGDEVLKAIGNLLLHHVRKEDVACRYGGEELTLIFPETSIETASARAEELRLKVEEFHPKYLGEGLGSITVSMGVAVYPEHGQTPEALLKAADGALYQAKHQGRNRVVVASGDSSDT